MNTNLEFAIPVQWNIENEYNLDDVVLNGENAYTAVNYVPSGTSLNNNNYWKRTGKYIRTDNIADGSITTPKFAENAITKNILPNVISQNGAGTTVTADDSGYLAELTIDGKSIQDGTPTPAAPVEIQVVQAPEGGTFGIQIGDTLTPINLQGNVLASLPDGTKDVLTVDSVGHVVLEKRVEIIEGGESGVSAYYSVGNQATGVMCTAKPYPGGKNNLQMLSDQFVFDGAKSNDGAAAHMQIGTFGYYYLPSGATPWYIYFKTAETFTSQSEVANWLSTHKPKFYYQKATPETIDLGYIDVPQITNESEISIVATVAPNIKISYWVDNGVIISEQLINAFNNINNIYGNLINVLASSIAKVENGVATSNYSANSYLMMNNVLYKVTSSIANGENIVPGTNVVATTVMDEVISLTS